MDPPSVYSAAFAMHTDYAEHEDSSYVSSSNVKSYHGLYAGNDTTCPCVDDVGWRNIERVDYNG
ncbi:hypothetical protein PR003_g10604 [Phytophthora rubi]|uniref:Uncharacterized protein n=1 Tax=Phytophthora rubi TaxID=129364 RepID=A0A6A4FAK4_9STRA|nr:hypothetical protein PR003_g10604 [Phytophthora rubi]